MNDVALTRLDFILRRLDLYERRGQECRPYSLYVCTESLVFEFCSISELYFHRQSCSSCYLLDLNAIEEECFFIFNLIITSFSLFSSVSLSLSRMF